jgi:hypothetical protein
VVHAQAADLVGLEAAVDPPAQEEVEPRPGAHLAVGRLLELEHVGDDVTLVEELLALGEEVTQPVEPIHM